MKIILDKLLLMPTENRGKGQAWEEGWRRAMAEGTSANVLASFNGRIKKVCG